MWWDPLGARPPASRALLRAGGSEQRRSPRGCPPRPAAPGRCALGGLAGLAPSASGLDASPPVSRVMPWAGVEEISQPVCSPKGEVGFGPVKRGSQGGCWALGSLERAPLPGLQPKPERPADVGKPRHGGRSGRGVPSRGLLLSGTETSHTDVRSAASV